MVERAGSIGSLTTVVHGAGAFDYASADAADPERSDTVLTVNLIAAIRLTRAVLPTLTQQPSSAVIFIASMAGQEYFANNAAYVASKHGLVAYARSVFLDVRDQGVKVSVLSPGLVAAGASFTLPAHSHRFFLDPIDVAEAVRYVLSTSARACPVEILLEPQRNPLL